MAMILPKGLVVNSREIEGQIERIAREPLAGEEIAKFWKVYTTTKRRLLDPTAERLENYWWRIWGSRKRDLNGATVARLFAEISDGESFVPLRSPANRDEGTLPPRRTQPGPVASSSSTTALPDVQHGTPSTISSPATSKTPIVMPPPILKKSRGPSTSGPRPTARFVSPHDSGEDPDPISPNAHVIVQPPSPDSQHPKVEKKATAGSTANGKKKGQAFVASTAANKKRPVIVRRPSSQTSQSSTDSASKAYVSAQQLAEIEASSKRAPPSVPVRKDSALGDIQSELNRKEKVQAPRFQENLSPSPATPSPKKRSQPPGDSTSASLALLRQPTISGAPKQVNGCPVAPAMERAPASEPGPSNLMQKIENGQTSIEELTLEEQEEVELQRLLLKEAKRNQHEPSRKPSSSSSKSEVQILHKSSRSNSDGLWKADMEAIRLLPGDVKSTVGLASVPIAGELTTEAVTKDLPRSASGKVDKGKGRDPEELAAIGEGSGNDGMFAKRPVQPISDASAGSSGITQPSRSKSQLTLLLEKDRARTDEHKKEEKKRGRSKDDKKRQKK